MSSLRIGTIGYRTKTGLGYQALSYVKNLSVSKVMVVDLSGHNGMPLTDWYPGAMTVHGYPSRHDIAEFLIGLDVVLLAETPLNYYLYEHARKAGIKTAAVINWEFFDHIVHPEFPLPDMIIMPTSWHFKDAEAFCISRGIRCLLLRHPVDRRDFPFRLRTTAKMLHVAGKPAVHDRNGTWDFLKAAPNGTVVTQSQELAGRVRTMYPRCRVYSAADHPLHIYQLGDVLVMPRRYGGNCLPVYEALSCGLPVVMPDISPNADILPKQWLVPARKTGSFTPRTAIDIYSVDIDALTDKLRWLESCDMTEQSRLADGIANSISWETLKPEYEKALAELCS